MAFPLKTSDEHNGSWAIWHEEELSA
jgi:hypothetical protein